MSYLVDAAPAKSSDAQFDPWAWRSARAPAPEAKPRESRRGRRLLMATFAIALASGAWAARTHGARLWVEPLLRGAGYPWRETGLRVEGVSSRLVAEGSASALVVEGAVENVGNREIAAPVLRLAVRSADGGEIFVWTAHPAKAHLAPGERSRFSSRLEAPPSAGVDVAVALGTKGD